MRFAISFQSDKSIAEYRELADIVDRYDFEQVSVYQDLFFQPPWPALFQFVVEVPRGGFSIRRVTFQSTST